MNSTFTTTRSLSVKVSLVLLLVIGSLLLLRPLVASEGKDKVSTKPLAASAALPSAESPDLAKRINSVIAENETGAARWGISVISPTDGSTVFQRNSDKLFTPASNMKIYTTGVALDLLGADYHWRTSVYANAQPDANGRVGGDLVLYGRGAPDLVATSKDEKRGSLARLADDLYTRGVRSIGGNVIGDESYFRGDAWGDGWQWTDLQWYFGAEASALTINGNEVDVNFVPSGKVGEPSVARTTDTEGYVTVQNRMAASDRNTRLTIGVHRGLSDNNIEMWGEFAPGTKGFGARLSVYKPALWAARLFVRALKTRGIQVDGQTLSRDSHVPPSQRFDPAHAVELAVLPSQSLGEIARQTNKESNNLYAELILRTLGRERGEMVGTAEGIGRERGDDETGLAVVRLWLERAGIPVTHLALHDGSGLSRLNLITPETSARLLLALSRTNSASVFKESLPISGRDGTLGGRMKSIADRVSAKTGSLTYDNSLSGYLTTSHGQTLVFSIMCNDQTGRAGSIGVIDQIVALLAAYPDSPAEKTQKSE
jgi:D-alanyl-D-alanine carboxypeptidase/D-alanyl-D-alanine-endopeptidase (penicillin-binding protein 4)